MKKKTKTTQTNKPIYSAQIEGAASNLNDTYAQQMPKVQGYADQIGGLTGDILSRYQQGDPALEGLPEIDFPPHRGRRHGSDLVLDAKPVCQIIQSFPDHHRRIHIGDQEAFFAVWPIRLNKDIN